MVKVLMIAAGGGVGAVLRYAISGWSQRLAGGTFPVGTLTVNVVGCLAMGLLFAAFAGPVLVREEHRLAVLIGLLGGFTTFSTFGYETFALLNDRQIGRAAMNVLLSNVLGIGAVWLGYRLGERWVGV